MVDNSPEVSNFNWLNLKLNQFLCNKPPVLPEHRLRPTIYLECSEQASDLHADSPKNSSLSMEPRIQHGAQFLDP